ncbi:MAG: XrtA/PEP-CTERM system histidine kinase PrsK [Pseudomonadota bacterium]
MPIDLVTNGTIAAVSYGLAGCVFLLLSALLLGNWGARQHARLLGGACVLTAVWAGGMAALIAWRAPLSAVPGGATALAANVLETMRAGAWLAFLLLLLTRSARRLKMLLGALGGMLALQLLAGTMAHATPAAPAAIVLRVLLAVLGMLLVEQWYRHTRPSERWGIKFASLGIGAMFAYDFYLYSDALLFRTINPEIWAARGVVVALTAPLLALSAARNPAWAPALALSRQVMLRSAALLGSAIYLLTMACSAYYLRYFGGAWGPLMQVAFLGGAALLLASVLFSGALRARLKVWINKHFYQALYDYRQEWQRVTRSLAADGPDIGQRSVQAIAELVESPAGALWIRRERGLCEPAASWNMAPRTEQESVEQPLCRFLDAKQWVIDVPACRQDPGRYPGLALPDWLHGMPQLWLLVPLMLHGRLYGFIALDKPRAPVEVNWEVTDLLKIAGSQAASYLAHRESADSLTVARQFESFNRMSTFIVHDLKNLVFQLSLLLSNAEKHQHNPAFQQDMLGTLDHSVRKMTLLLQKLSRGDARDDAAPLLIEQVLAEAVAAKATASPAPQLRIEQGGLTVMANWARLERVLGHIIQNAIEASARDGKVVVRLLREAHSAVVELKDSGQGMSEQFMRERLFKPFESTKAAGMGIGVFESREYIREVGGQLEVDSELAVGTTFRVILPLHPDPGPA